MHQINQYKSYFHPQQWNLQQFLSIELKRLRLIKSQRKIKRFSNQDGKIRGFGNEKNTQRILGAWETLQFCKYFEKYSWWNSWFVKWRFKKGTVSYLLERHLAEIRGNSKAREEKSCKFKKNSVLETLNKPKTIWFIHIFTNTDRSGKHKLPANQKIDLQQFIRT